MSADAVSEEPFGRFRRTLRWLLPVLWAVSLAVPAAQHPWPYMVFCLAAFVLALRAGLLEFTGGTVLVGLLWFGLGAVVLIADFARIYQITGLLVDGTLRDVSKGESLYFSVVTWTTLGYGDYTPPPRAHLFAALEALLGYVYMAVSIGTLLAWLGGFLRKT